MATPHATHPDPAKHHGTLNHLPPSPQEELENLGLVKSGASSHASHHPDHDHDDESKPTSAGSPTIKRPVA